MKTLDLSDISIAGRLCIGNTYLLISSASEQKHLVANVLSGGQTDILDPDLLEQTLEALSAGVEDDSNSPIFGDHELDLQLIKLFKLDSTDPDTAARQLERVVFYTYLGAAASIHQIRKDDHLFQKGSEPTLFKFSSSAPPRFKKIIRQRLSQLELITASSDAKELQIKSVRALLKMNKNTREALWRLILKDEPLVSAATEMIRATQT